MTAWPSRLDRIGQRRDVLRAAGVSEPALTALSCDDSRGPGQVRRAVRDATARGMGGAEVASAVLRMGGASVEVRVAPVAEVETPRQQQVRAIGERLACAIARREALGKSTDEAELFEVFRPVLGAALRDLGVRDVEAAEHDGAALWREAWDGCVNHGI